MAISVTQAFKDRHKAAVDNTRLKVEVNFTGVPAFPGAPVIVGGTWVDITEWAESASGSLEEVSQLGGGASANSMNLTLFNDDGRWSQRNSAGPYYGNLKPNRPMRASSVSGSESVRIFTGFSGAWPTQAKARTCTVSAQDAARILLRSDITEETVFNPGALTTGYWLTKVLERAAWLSGWRWDTVNTKTDVGGNSWAFDNHDGIAITVNKSGGAAVATYTYGGTLVMQLDLVDLLIPVAPLKGKALAVLDQLAKVVDGKIYFGSQGQLVFRCPMYRNDSTLVSVETFDVDNLDDLIADQNYENSRFSQVVNHAEVTSTPYEFKLDDSGAAQEEDIPFKGDLFARYHFNAGESYPGASDAELWCELPNGLKIAKTASYPDATNVLLETADKSDITKPGTGLRFKAGFPVFEQTRMKVAFENTGSSAEVIKTLTLKVRLMRQIQRCRAVRKNQASIDTYDKRDWTYNNDLIPSASACENLGAWKVVDGHEPKMHVTLPAMYGCPWMEINDRITASETITNSLPVAEDFVVKRIKWAWALAGFGFITEACSLSPDFSMGALPATAVKVETSNQNMNGSQQGALPPQVIDGTQALVGLNNSPAFSCMLMAVQKVTVAGMSIANSLLFDGASLFVSDNDTGKVVYRVNPMTGAVIASQNGDANAKLGSMAIGKDGSGTRLLFVRDAGVDKILVTEADVFGSFSTKALLGDYVPFQVLVVGGKLVATVKHATNNNVYLLVWNTISNTRQDTPDSTVTLSTLSSHMPYSMTTDGRQIFIAMRSFALANQDQYVTTYDLATGAVDLDAIEVTHPDSPGGVMPYGIAHDGVNLWLSIEHDGGPTAGSWIARYRPSGAGSYVLDKTIKLTADLVIYASALKFDGSYIWANRIGYLTQIALTGDVIADFVTDTTQDGDVVFDGINIWATSGDGYLMRVPRIVTGRQF